ncbi:MAG: glycoside hydrolase [Gammaproteobacteria bacterium]
MKSHAFLLALMLLLMASVGSVRAQAQAVAVDLGQAMVRLNGPWLFHVGDNAQWADPGFDDSGWQHMDLSAAPGATDGDVGLPNYAPGWSAKGHPGYYGYAWYRIHLNIQSTVGGSLALLGPWAVDSAYQVYENGKLLGGVGNFSSTTPKAYSYHYPAIFALPSVTRSSAPMVIAIRVWMGPWGAAAPGSGGIHIAPVIGKRDAITAGYHLQWLTIFEGYVVDTIPALLFFLAALMVLCMWSFDRGDRTYLWLAAALTLSGIQRGNQAFFFWWQIETIQDFVIFILALAGSLSLGVWMMTWRSWFKMDRPAWLPKAVAALTLALFVAQLLAYPWLFQAAYPHAVGIGMHYLIRGLRLAFLLVLVLIVYQGIRRQGREGWYALPVILAIGAVLFTAELSEVHVPGIWFPFGVGLSLSECASVIFVLLLFALLLRRLWSNVRHLQSA